MLPHHDITNNRRLLLKCSAARLCPRH
jgi:hypothetical protein